MSKMEKNQKRIPSSWSNYSYISIDLYIYIIYIYIYIYIYKNIISCKQSEVECSILCKTEQNDVYRR